MLQGIFNKRTFLDWRGYLLGFVLVTLITLIAYAVKAFISLTDLVLVYMLCIVITGILRGPVPSITVSVISVPAANYFFIAPLAGFGPINIQDIRTLTVMFTVGLIISFLASSAHWRISEARRREKETNILYQLSQKLADSNELETSMESIVNSARETMGYDVLIYLPDYGSDQVLRVYPEDKELNAGEKGTSAAIRSYETRKKTGQGTDAFPDLKMIYIPLMTSRSIAGVLAVDTSGNNDTTLTAHNHLLDAFANIAAMAIEQGLVKLGLNHLASFPNLHPQPIIELNNSERFLYINPAADMTFPDLRIKGLDHPYLADLKTIVENLKDRNERSLTRQIAVDKKYFQQTILLTEENASVRVYGVDITERLKLAEESQRIKDTQVATEKLQMAFLDSISHDLRTPLSSVIGVLTSLQEDLNIDDATRKNLIQVACEEAERLNESITNLLDISKIEAGVINISKQLSDVHDIISMALDELGERKNIRNIQINISPGLPLIFVDFSLILRVIFNLIDNAIKYSSNDSPIEISAVNVTEGIKIEVADRGDGIPPGDLPYIFNRFYRGRKASISGTGLGLSICKGIIEAHGGSITAENRPGGGTIMRLILPLANNTG